MFGYSKYSLLVGVDPFKIILIHLPKNIAFRGYKQLFFSVQYVDANVRRHSVGIYEHS